MHLPDQTSYLAEAMKGGYDFDSEDRLSQVFSASFNHSPTFRRLFYSFAKIKPLTNPRSTTQQCEKHPDNDGRLDVCLKEGNQERVIIESKKDARLEIEQLIRYSKMHPTTKRIALVKNCIKPFQTAKGWTILHWGDFYRHLKNSSTTTNGMSIDGFIINNFCSHMEGVELNTVTKIKDTALVSLSRVLCSMRTEQQSEMSLSLPIFETASGFVAMLEGIIERASENSSIQKVVAKDCRVAPKLRWYTHEEYGPSCEIFVRLNVKYSKHPVLSVSTRIVFLENIFQVFIERKMRNRKSAAKKEVEYLVPRETGLKYDDYADHVIGQWAKWLKVAK